jgi:hypothetical protein
MFKYISVNICPQPWDQLRTIRCTNCRPAVWDIPIFCRILTSFQAAWYGILAVCQQNNHYSLSFVLFFKSCILYPEFGILYSVFCIPSPVSFSCTPNLVHTILYSTVYHLPCIQYSILYRCTLRPVKYPNPSILHCASSVLYPECHVSHARCTLYPVSWTLDTVPCTLYFVACTLCVTCHVPNALYPAPCIGIFFSGIMHPLYAVFCILYPAPCFMHTAPSTPESFTWSPVPCILYSELLYSVYSCHGIFYPVSCFLYYERSRNPYVPVYPVFCSPVASLYLYPVLCVLYPGRLAHARMRRKMTRLNNGYRGPNLSSKSRNMSHMLYQF